MSHTSNGKGQSGLEPTLRYPLTSLLRALTLAPQAPIPCAECRRHLSALYHHMLQPQEPQAVEYQTVIAHLQACPECAEEFAALAAVMDEYDAGTLPSLAHTPHFDLSFMDEPAMDEPGVDKPGVDKPGVDKPGVDKAGVDSPAAAQAPLLRTLRDLTGEVVVLIQAGWAKFGTWPAPLTPITVTGTLFRSELGEGQAEVLVLPAPDAGLSVHLAVGPVIAGKAAIAIKLLEMATTQPLAGTRVTLRNGDHQLLAGAVTGHDGATLFEQLPLGRYFVQVRHNQQSWEIPLLLVEGKPADEEELSRGDI